MESPSTRAAITKLITLFRCRWEDLIPFVTFGPNQPKLRPGTPM
jgi:hypothetical protein